MLFLESLNDNTQLITLSFDGAASVANLTGTSQLQAALPAIYAGSAFTYIVGVANVVDVATTKLCTVIVSNTTITIQSQVAFAAGAATINPFTITYSNAIP